MDRYLAKKGRQYLYSRDFYFMDSIYRGGIVATLKGLAEGKKCILFGCKREGDKIGKGAVWYKNEVWRVKSGKGDGLEFRSKESELRQFGDGSQKNVYLLRRAYPVSIGWDNDLEMRGADRVRLSEFVPLLDVVKAQSNHAETADALIVSKQVKIDLINEYGDIDGGEKLYVRKIGNLIEITGAFYQPRPTSFNVMGYLPPEFRPQKQVVITAHGTANTAVENVRATVLIDTNGTIRINGEIPVQQLMRINAFYT